MTKSMLRATYAKLSEKNVEIEEAADEKRGLGMGLGAAGGDDGGGAAGGRGGPMFRDFGGIEMILENLIKEVVLPFYYPEMPGLFGTRPPLGVLLHGPPGCGKTRLAHAIANETGVPFYKISATEIVSGVSGEAK